MDFVSALSSNPLPVSISVIIAVACLLGYYFFVLPMIDENRQLKEEKKEMEERLRDQGVEANAAFVENINSIGHAITDIKESMSSDSNLCAQRYELVGELVESVSNLQHTLERGTTDMTNQLLDFGKSLQSLRDLSQSHFATDSVRAAASDRVHQELNRNLVALNEKNSQIIGALMGMSRLQDRNRSI